MAEREVSGGNPMLKIAQALRSSPALQDLLWQDPRAAIEQLTTKIPQDIGFDIRRGEDGIAYFTSSIPKLRLGEHAHQSMRTCPVAQLSGQELMADPVAALGRFGIRVPEDVQVTADEEPDGFVHFTMVLEE
jgi:hypothetical protein